ncbi:MAG: 4Fe-4S dicluster domain-containing protein [Bacteroidales bacterium]|nr:4Fe-4S dicluster domain-containing protein [Bacteroidales bacterium]MDD4683739.1 4Fe-4S dicluster domain-containing protein [Bacteroidales bacterium]
MKTNEYKFFISDCKEAIEKNKSIDISYDIEDISLRNFKSYNNAKKKSANLRQKYINHIDELLVSFDKNFTEGGLDINWSIDYNNLIEDLIKLFNDNKIKEVNVFESKLIKELGIIKNLKEEEFTISPQSKNCVIFEPRYAISQTGSLFLDFESAFEMELVMEAEFKIFILPFNNILKNLEDIEILSQLYSINKNKTNYVSLTSIYTPKTNKEKNVELFIVDNGRTSLLESKEHRKALTCIDCDACKKVCPVYALIGDKPYNNVFTGPIANVVLPFLETVDGCKHLSFNCVLCGNCTKVCPMNIPLTDLIIANRNMFFENRNMDYSDRYKVKVLKNHLISRNKLNKQVWRKEILLKFLIKRKLTISRPFPKFAKETFSHLKSHK